MSADNKPDLTRFSGLGKKSAAVTFVDSNRKDEPLASDAAKSCNRSATPTHPKGCLDGTLCSRKRYVRVGLS
jgi:hypothetical protein